MAIVVKCSDGSSFSALGRVQVGRGEHGLPAEGTPDEIFEFAPIIDSEDTAQLRVLGDGVEIVVENVAPDSGPEVTWALVDHLCKGETALLRCDGCWRFRVTVPAAAAGCEFVCERRELAPALPPLAPAPPGASPIDMLLEASRIQPQASQSHGSVAADPIAAGAPALDSAPPEATPGSPAPFPAPTRTGGAAAVPPLRPAGAAVGGGLWRVQPAVVGGGAALPDSQPRLPGSRLPDAIPKPAWTAAGSAAIDEQTWKEMGFECEEEARLVLGDATFDGTADAADPAQRDSHRFDPMDGSAPGDSFNISADAVRDTDGSGANDGDGEEGAQSQVQSESAREPPAAAPGGPLHGAVVTSGFVPDTAAAASGVDAGGAAKRGSSVHLPGWERAQGDKRARLLDRVDGADSEAAEGGAGAADAADCAEAPFALMWIRYKMPAPLNHGCFGVKLRQVVHGNIELAVVSNYMVDVRWLLSACPDLRRAKEVVVLHGEASSRMRGLVADAGLPSMMQVTVHAPPLPIPYGTHHSKFFLLKYATGVRVIIHTANLIFCDCNNKTQALFYQDFPLKASAPPATAPTTPPPGGSDFQSMLLLYFRKLGIPSAAKAAIEAAIQGADFSSARVALVASTPGRHVGAALPLFGHMRVRAVLERHGFAGVFRGAPLAAQFSSLGSLTQPWLEREFAASVSAGRVLAEDGEGPSEAVLGAPTPPKPPQPGAQAPPVQLVWPTKTQIANSFEGWAAGLSVPGYAHNVGKPFLRPLWSRWGGELAARQRAMPHIKCYCRYSGDEVAWVLVGSHNLSKAAWGELQKERSSLFIRSYELAVLCLPALEAHYRRHPHRGFSCTAPTPDAAAPPPPLRGAQPLLRCPQSALPPRCRAAAATRPLPRVASDVATGQFGRWSGMGEAGTPGERKVHRGALYQSSMEIVDLSGTEGTDPSVGPAATRPDGSKSENPSGAKAASAGAGTSTAAEAAEADEGVEYVPVPIPFALPPQPYGASDAPWTVDGDSAEMLLDTHGLRRDEAVGSMYGYLQDVVQPYFQDNN